MAHFTRCDVKGCDNSAPVTYLGENPTGWRTVSFEIKNKEQAAAAFEHYQADPAKVKAGRVVTIRVVDICPDHELPEFDEEPCYRTNQL